jgi:hypothetical protein
MNARHASRRALRSGSAAPAIAPVVTTPAHLNTSLIALCLHFTNSNVFKKSMTDLVRSKTRPIGLNRAALPPRIIALRASTIED